MAKTKAQAIPSLYMESTVLSRDDIDAARHLVHTMRPTDAEQILEVLGIPA